MPSHIRYVGVVKADAYGHGLYPIAATLMRCKIDLLAVATVYEAAEVRQISADFPILVMSPVLPEEEPFLVDHRLSVVVSTFEEVERLEMLAQRTRLPISIHLKVDTGMGRLGVWYEQVLELWEKIHQSNNLVLAGIMTHFACAGTNDEMTRMQRQRFNQLLKSLPDLNPKQVWIHEDNSSGLQEFDVDKSINAVRVGLLQYGINSLKGEKAKIQVYPIISFFARVGVIKSLPQGTSISYDATYSLKRDTRVAIVTAGYADGIPLGNSNRGYVLIRGKRCLILGRVAMDQMIVDVTDYPEIQMGDEVVLFGRRKGESASIDLDEFSGWSESMPWERLCDLSKRVKRVYRTKAL